MRLIAAFIALLLIPFTAIPAEESEPGTTGHAGASGAIHATVKIAENLSAEFVDGPDSTLPEAILERIKPSLMAKARGVHLKAPSDDGIYRMAIDWKIVSVNGQDQMKFEYRNSPPYAIQQLAPEFPRMNSTTPIKIVFLLSVEPDGTVSSVNRDEGFSGNTDFYHAGKLALKRWKFSPLFRDGIAVASEVQMPFTFGIPTEHPDEWPSSGSVKVTFGLSGDGEVDWLDVDGELPDCINSDELRQQLMEQVSASDVAQQVRAGKSSLRRGAFKHPLEPCEGAD